MRKLMALVLVFMLASAGMVRAQENTVNIVAAQSKQSFTPIDVQDQSYDYYDADEGWSTAISTSYSFKGSLLTKPQDYERVIYPLNDPQANQLLHSAADKDGWGEGLLWGGIAVQAAGWTDFTIEMLGMGTTTDASGHITDHTPNTLPSAAMVLGGVGILVKGLFLQIDATSDRANAVARYNNVVQPAVGLTSPSNGPDISLSMMALPNTNTVGLGLTQQF